MENSNGAIDLTIACVNVLLASNLSHQTPRPVHLNVNTLDLHTAKKIQVNKVYQLVAHKLINLRDIFQLAFLFS